MTCPLRRLVGAAACAAALFYVQAGALSAQDLPRSAVIVIDSERLFANSELGILITRQLEEQAQQLAAENRRMEADLMAEEQALTDRRATTDPQKFRRLAEAFDEKVTRIRREQEEKARLLGKDSDAARRRFLSAAQPVLRQIMIETGAAVMMEQRQTFISVEDVDVTNQAIARIDAALDQGGADALRELPVAPETEDGGDPAVVAPGLNVPPQVTPTVPSVRSPADTGGEGGE